MDFILILVNENFFKLDLQTETICMYVIDVQIIPTSIILRFRISLYLSGDETNSYSSDDFASALEKE